MLLRYEILKFCLDGAASAWKFEIIILDIFSFINVYDSEALEK